MDATGAGEQEGSERARALDAVRPPTHPPSPTCCQAMWWPPLTHFWWDIKRYHLNLPPSRFSPSALPFSNFLSRPMFQPDGSGGDPGAERGSAYF